MDLMTRRRAIMGMPSGKDYTVTGNVVSISNALAKNAKSLIVSFSPKQSGSGDPSPSNVRPITGYNDIGAVRYGKNLLGGSALKADLLANISKATDGGNDIVNVGTQGKGSLAFSDFKENTRYTLFLDILPVGTYIGGAVNYTDGTATYFGTGMVAGERTLIVYTSSANKTVESIRISNGAPAYTVYCNTSGIFVGNIDASAFEPYISPVTANVHSDTTLFGGTVDLVSGECQLNGMLETFNMDNGTTISSQLNSFAKNSSGVSTVGSYTRISFAVRGDVDQTQFNRLSNTYATPFCNYAKHYFAYNSESTHWYRNGTMYLFLPTSVVGSTAQSVYDYLVNIMNTEPLSAWVELATPITHTLTPSQLALLKGNNTVYSNEGSISLTYVGK